MGVMHGYPTLQGVHGTAPPPPWLDELEHMSTNQIRGLVGNGMRMDVVFAYIVWSIACAVPVPDSNGQK